MNSKQQPTNPGDAGKPAPRVPWWMWVVIIAAAAPGLGYPAMLAGMMAEPPALVRGLMWLYPTYVLVSTLLAWQCYGRRTVMSWIIIVLLCMSHACIYYLSTVTI